MISMGYDPLDESDTDTTLDTTGDQSVSPSSQTLNLGTYSTTGRFYSLDLYFFMRWVYCMSVLMGVGLIGVTT